MQFPLSAFCVFAAAPDVLDVLTNHKRIEKCLPSDIDDRFIPFPVIQKQYGLSTVGARYAHACAHIVSINRFNEAGLRPCRFQWWPMQMLRVTAMIRWAGFQRSQPVQQRGRRNGQRADWYPPPRQGQQTAIVRRLPIDHEHVFRRRANHPFRRVVETNGSAIDEENAASRRRFP